MPGEILPDPRALVAAKGAVAVQVLQIHRAIPKSVQIGHFDAGGVEVVEHVVSRTVYLDLIQQACAVLGDGLEVRFYDHREDGFDAVKSFFAYDSRLDLPWSELPPTLTHVQLVTKAVRGRDAHHTQVRARGLIPDVHPDSQFFYK